MANSGNMEREQHVLETEKLVKALILNMARSETRSPELSLCCSDESSSEKCRPNVAKKKRRRRRSRRKVLTVTECESDLIAGNPVVPAPPNRPDSSSSEDELPTKDDEDLTKNNDDLLKDGDDLTKGDDDLTKGDDALTKDDDDFTKDDDLTRDDDDLTRDGDDLTKDVDELTRDGDDLTKDDDDLTRECHACACEESGSDISQDEIYPESIRRDFVLDYEQQMVNEYLLNENEKLNEVLHTLETKLTEELEKSTTVHASLNELKSDNSQLQRQKTRLQKTVKTHVDVIEDLKSRLSALKKTRDELAHETDAKKNARKSKFECIQNELSSKDEQLKSVKDRNRKRYEDMTRAHEDLMSKVSEQARGITKALSKTLGCGPRGTKDVLGLLQEASTQLALFSDKTVPLQNTVQELKTRMENQVKSISKLNSEKKCLKEELFELGKQNKSLSKDKAKLEREIESLKKESVKAKNLSQSFKTRLEELKAGIRAVRREKDTVVQEKQNAELRLKNLGVDHEALKKELKARKTRKGCGRSGPRMINRLLTPKVKEELQSLFLKSTEELDDLDTSLTELERRKRNEKEKLRSSEAVREYLKKNTSRLVHKHEELCKRSERLDYAIAKMTADGEQLAKMVRSVMGENLHMHDQVEMFIDELNHGHMQQCALKRSFHQNCVVLARYVGDNRGLETTNRCLETKVAEVTGNWEQDKGTLERTREELRKARSENDALRSERRRYERSLANYKELIRGYSRVASRSSEMKMINRELLSFVALLQKQKDVMVKKVNGLHDEINLIHAMYQKLKSFSGKQTKRTSSVDSNDGTSQKSLQVALDCLREKLQSKKLLISTLKRSVDAERSEADQLHEKIVKLLSNEESVSLQLCALKIYRKSKRNGFMAFKRKRTETERANENDSGSLNEKQFSIVIQLILAKQELANEIKESLEMENRLCLFAKHGEEYTTLLHTKCFSEQNSGLSPEKSNQVGELLAEKKRIENEFAFNDAHEGLLEKQVSLLKKQRKFCAKTLRKYEEELEGIGDQSIVQALVDILMTSVNGDVIHSEEAPAEGMFVGDSGCEREKAVPTDGMVDTNHIV